MDHIRNIILTRYYELLKNDVMFELLYMHAAWIDMSCIYYRIHMSNNTIWYDEPYDYD